MARIKPGASVPVEQAEQGQVAPVQGLGYGPPGSAMTIFFME
ncbi:MAG: hypothetical protein VCB63_07755 [Alphaproteobacteria bacterium]|tara:strand:- start:348 stop:473 length:126 start_codon:yes stop_codon:yes gene_type:complete